jgi:hypothetical protein
LKREKKTRSKRGNEEAWERGEIRRKKTRVDILFI